MELDIIGSLYTEDCPTKHQQLTDDRDCGVCDFAKRLNDKQAHYRNQNAADKAGNRKTALQTCDFYVGHLWHSFLLYGFISNTHSIQEVVSWHSAPTEYDVLHCENAAFDCSLKHIHTVSLIAVNIVTNERKFNVHISWKPSQLNNVVEWIYLTII